MIERLTHNATAWRYAAIVALVALLVRALVPVGWMPAGASTQGAEIVICTLSGMKHIAVDDQTSGDPQKHSESQAPCAFAAMASLAPPVSQQVFVAPRDVWARKLTPFAAHFASSDVTPWYSRGPPAQRLS